jgi:hypothetical protein
MKLLRIFLFSLPLFVPFFFNAQTLLSFQSTKFGYSLKYPDNFKQKPTKSGSADFNAVRETGFATVNVNILPFEFRSTNYSQVTKKTIEDIIKPLVTYFNITKFSKTKVSGVDAIIIYCDVTSQETTFSQITAFVYWSKTPLTFTCCCYKKDFGNYTQLFQTIIGSLKL